MKTILLKFAGPLQSWGTGSQFENRSTDRYPSKSAVIGLLAASLGYSRDDKRIARFNLLDFAVRVDQPGELLTDYHTAQKLKPNGQVDRVYVTNRQYLQDAVFVVALGSDRDDWMAEIEHGLKRPRFQPFLGRRSNPLTADFFIGTKKQDVITCLRDLEWQAAAWYKRKNGNNAVLSIYADAHLIEKSPKQMVRDEVISFSQRERRHGYRAVARKNIALMPSKVKETHDVFNAF
ncbi:MAG TPA: type I-E CRISPR-associated protein Cas5/CasD [Firmicutes bacterium]|nr:type I-E CRISPR-associated protein Cas5/CasD [Bacillota bacterium]